MPYKITYDRTNECIIAQFTGTVDMPLALQYLSELIPFFEKHACRRLLNDTTQATLQLSGRDIVSFPRMAALSKDIVQCKRALWVKPNAGGHLLFESLSKMAGHRVKSFYNRDEAMKWLLED